MEYYYKYTYVDHVTIIMYELYLLDQNNVNDRTFLLNNTYNNKKLP